MSAVVRPSAIAELRAHIATVGTSASVIDALPFGLDQIDGRLADQGLAVGALHEVAPATPTLADEAAATLFLTGIAARFRPEEPVLWALTRFDLYGPGLEQAGLTPERLLFAEVPDDRTALAVAEDAVRHGSLAAVVAEVRRMDMTAARRLQLAAAEGSTPILLLRRWRRAESCPLEEPSTATTRWRIACAPSAPLGVPGVGRVRWDITLVRQRNGNPFSLIVEGCDAQGRLGFSAPAVDRAAGAETPFTRAA